MATLISEGLDPRKIPLLGTVAPPSLAPLAPMTSAAMPSLDVPVAPNVIDNPRMNSSAVDPLAARSADLSADIYRRENPIAPTTALGKIGHVASSIGNVLGEIFAPGTMALIPGTQLGNRIKVNQDQSDLQNISQLQTAADQRKQEEALTNYTGQRPQIEQAKLSNKLSLAMDKITQQAAARGQRVSGTDENGLPTFEDDPALLAHAAQQATLDWHQAQADLANDKSDPNSPLYQQKERAMAIAHANAVAAQTRANAYMGNYNMRAFNTDNQGNILPGAPQITNPEGGVTTVGSTNASQAVKAQANAAQFNDVNGAENSVRNAAQELEQSGGKLNSPAVVAALQIPHGTISQWIASVNKANLTPAERDYVISNIAFRENLQGLRKSSGGSVSDSQVENLLNMAPSGSTPDTDYLNKQLDQIGALRGRLAKGVTTVKGGLKVDNAPSTTLIRALDPNGVLHEAPSGTPLPKGWKLQ